MNKLLKGEYPMKKLRLCILFAILLLIYGNLNAQGKFHIKINTTRR